MDRVDAQFHPTTKVFGALLVERDNVELIKDIGNSEFMSVSWVMEQMTEQVV